MMIQRRLGIARVMIVGTVIGAAFAMARQGWTADLDAAQNLNGGAALQLSDAVTGEQDVTPNGSWWRFADKNGDLVYDDPVAPPGLTMTGTGYLYTDDGATPILLNLNGGDISGAAVKALSTYVTTSPGTPQVRIANVGDIAMGGIDARNGRGNTGIGGHVTIGAADNRAGTVRIGYIDAYPVQANGSWGGTVNIYGSGSVRIEDSSETAGQIQTWGRYGDSTASRLGSVTVSHDGLFRSGAIKTYFLNGEREAAGNVTLEGNAMEGQAADNPRGTCTVGDIDAYEPSTSIFAYGGGSVDISGYKSVETGRIYTYCNSTGGDRGGSISIRDITESIRVAAVDLHSGTGDGGNLTLRCGATITLHSLDFSKMDNVTFNVANVDGVQEDVQPWNWVFVENGSPANYSGDTGTKNVNCTVYYIGPDGVYPDGEPIAGGGVFEAIQHVGELPTPPPPGAVLVIT